MTVQPYIPGIEGLHSKVERTIAKRLIRTILEAGYDVRIHEGEDWAMDKRSNDPKTIFDNMASTDEDRVYFCKTSDFKIYEMKPFGEYRRDGLDTRMLLGANQTGSDNWQKALGWKGNPATLSARGSAFIKRAQLGYATQVTAGL